MLELVLEIHRNGGSLVKIGIIGTPQSGKSTIFQLLTNVESSVSSKANVGIAKVPDPRISRLSLIFKPKRTTYATIEFVDIAGLVSGQSKKGNEFLKAVRDVDAIVQVIRAFENELVPTIDGNISPIRDLNQIQSELILTDWSLLETRMEKLVKERVKNPNATKELAVLEKCKDVLENDLPLRSLDLDEEEDKLIRGYDFFTRKPLLLVINVDEDQIRSSSYLQQDELSVWANERSMPLVMVSGQVEMEINQLDDDDKAMFMTELGIEETGISRLAQAVYEHLGLISYFTVGEDEVRAWTIRQGMSARQGAGKIHSDIERGFIRAEVVSNQEFIEYGSMQKLKEKGLFRLEGKEYIIKDGDIINFRFNV